MARQVEDDDDDNGEDRSVPLWIECSRSDPMLMCQLARLEDGPILKVTENMWQSEFFARK